MPDWQNMPAWVREYAMRVMGAILILMLGWIANRALVGPLSRLVNRSRIDVSVASFLVSSARAAIVVVVVLAVLQQFGLETTSLLTLLGTAGLAIALSLQGSLANFASGLLLLAFRSVRVGDSIEVGDVRGRISEMLPFHIVVETMDNQRITVPNTLLTNGPVRNNSYLAARRVQWTLSLGPRDDLAAIKSTLRERLLADSRIYKEPPPVVYVQEWALEKRLLCVTAWAATTDYLRVQQEMLEQLGSSLEGVRSQRANEPAQS